MVNNDDYDDRRHLSRDVRDAHVAASAARMMAILALILGAIALAVSIMAWNKANDAIGKAERSMSVSQQQ